MLKGCVLCLRDVCVEEMCVLKGCVCVLKGCVCVEGMCGVLKGLCMYKGCVLC